MPDIHYETKTEDVYRIDEVSQRLLVYLHLHGGSSIDEAVNPTGADSEATLQARINEQLGAQAAGLVEEDSYTQATVSGEKREISRYQVTEKGEVFVYNNRSRLSMPADLAELAKKVAELRVWQDEMEMTDLRVDDLEERVAEIEDKLENRDI